MEGLPVAVNMVSTAELVAGRCLRSVVAAVADGEPIAESADFAELQSALERLLPAVLREAYPAQWRWEALDGFRLAVARRTGPGEAELLGLCLLISDQTWTPLHVRLRASPEDGGISWLLCRVGDGGAAGVGMTRLPYGSSTASQLLASMGEGPDSIDWAFSVERS